MNKEEFITSLKKYNINYNEDMLLKLDNYYNMIVEYNSHTNITAITNKEDAYLKHFFDSLTVSFAVDLNSQKTLLDVGTGAGFPGIVLKIFFPHLKITLLDSNSKKTTFLNNVISALELTEIEVVTARCEDYIKNNRSKYDVVVARAVKQLNILAELCIPFVKVSGLFVAMKGKNLEELKDGKKAINILNSKIESEYKLELTDKEYTRNIIVVKKLIENDSLYPRDYSKIIKKPLK